jgi:two-component system, OmpR family, response regulator MtrA
MSGIENIHVLVIEDNQDAAWSVKKLLEQESTGGVTFTVETAQDLTTATVALKSGRVDAVLLDLHLPNAPAGADLVKVVRAVAPNIDIIALTGWSGETLRQDVMDAGAQDYLTKPAVPSELARKLMHSVIYRRSDAARHRLEDLLERLGPAMEAAARATGDSGGFKFPPLAPPNP